jgi:hypothetical protein
VKSWKIFIVAAAAVLAALLLSLYAPVIAGLVALAVVAVVAVGFFLHRAEMYFNVRATLLPRP